MVHWPSVQITKNMVSGEETVLYSMTPEAFVQELQKTGERLVVARGGCRECHYIKNDLISRKERQRMEEELLHYGHIPECLCVSIAKHPTQRRLLPQDLPELVICYAFYYMHYTRSPYLKAAHDAGLIEFIDVDHLPGFKETGTFPVLPIQDEYTHNSDNDPHTITREMLFG